MVKALQIIVCLSVIGYGLAHSRYGSRGKPSRKSFSLPRYPTYGLKSKQYGYAKYNTTTQQPTTEEYCVGKFFCGLHKTPHSAMEECVVAGKVCDGYKDCKNGADERFCPPPCLGRFLCHDKRTCATPCNGIRDCPTGEDEDCPDSCHCAEGTFKCLNEDLCLPASKACDGQKDCLDGSDENDCSAACKCGAGNYLCKNEALCITPDKFCDGINVCEEADDEADCPSTCFCGAGQYICSTFGEIAPLCIDQMDFCGETNSIDCPREEDEGSICPQ